MEKEIINGEQPIESEQALNNDIVKKEIESGGVDSQQEGSQFGKFSTAEELFKAYNNLQSEFTRKCQKLSEIQKQFAEKEIEGTSSIEDETKEISPAFEKETWQSEVAEFLQQNDNAKEFSREISKEILKDKSLQSSPNMLELAWARVLSKNYKTPKQLTEETSFVDEFVLKNEQVKQKVFGKYLEELQKAPPVIGSGIKGGGSLLTRVNKPANLNDAKVLAEKLFKN